MDGPTGVSDLTSFDCFAGGGGGENSGILLEKCIFLGPDTLRVAASKVCFELSTTLPDEITTKDPELGMREDGEPDESRAKSGALV